MVLTSAPRVRPTGVVQTSSRFGTVGSGNTDRSSPPYSPPGPLLTYQVSPPREVTRLSRAVMVCAPLSTDCPSQIPDGVPMPGLTQGRPRVIAPLMLASGCPVGQVPL